MLFVSVILGGAASCRLAGFAVPSEEQRRRLCSPGRWLLGVSVGPCSPLSAGTRLYGLYGCVSALRARFSDCGQTLAIASRREGRVKRPCGEREGSLGTGGQSLRGRAPMDVWLWKGHMERSCVWGAGLLEDEGHSSRGWRGKKNVP